MTTREELQAALERIGAAEECLERHAKLLQAIQHSHTALAMAHPPAIVDCVTAWGEQSDGMSSVDYIDAMRVELQRAKVHIVGAQLSCHFFYAHNVG